MINRILIGLAGTTFAPVAIQRAVELGKAHAAEVTGVTVLDPHRLRRWEQPAQMAIEPLSPHAQCAWTNSRADACSVQVVMVGVPDENRAGRTSRVVHR